MATFVASFKSFFLPSNFFMVLPSNRQLFECLRAICFGGNEDKNRKTRTFCIEKVYNGRLLSEIFSVNLIIEYLFCWYLLF